MNLWKNLVLPKSQLEPFIQMLFLRDCQFGLIAVQVLGVRTYILRLNYLKTTPLIILKQFCLIFMHFFLKHPFNYPITLI